MIALRAARPEEAALLALFTPMITSAVTSGTTVICRALSHSRPTGRAHSATCRASGWSQEDRLKPTSAPKIKPIRTFTGAERRKRRAVRDGGMVVAG